MALFSQDLCHCIHKWQHCQSCWHQCRGTTVKRWAGQRGRKQRAWGRSRVDLGVVPGYDLALAPSLTHVRTCPVSRDAGVDTPRVYRRPVVHQDTWYARGQNCLGVKVHAGASQLTNQEDLVD
eukprot:697473-Rhodomonas_salina.2